MSPPVSTILLEESSEVAVEGGVLGTAAFLPAVPDRAGPGASEDADGVGVVGAAWARAVVDLACPGVPVSSAVGRDARVFAQALVTGPAKLGSIARAGLDRDRGLAGVGGVRVVGWVASALGVLVGRPSEGGCSVVALGASHRREALVSCGSSKRRVGVVLSRRWSAMCAERSVRSSSLRSGKRSLALRETETSRYDQSAEVVL